MEVKAQNWLITGGCGFIGVNLVAHLLAQQPPPQIRILDNLSVGTRADLAAVSAFREIAGLDCQGPPQGVELLVGDIRDPATCLASCAGIDIVVHLAANTGVAPSIADPRQDLDINVLGTFNMLEAARQQGVKNFVFASSGAVVGEVMPPITEDKPPKPVSPYGASKLAGEGYCSAYYRAFGVKTAVLRFGNVYGPRSKHKSSVVAKFFQLALAGLPLEIYGDGQQTRDFIYIQDLIQAIMLAAASDVGGEVFQIATHKETTVNEIAEKIKELVEGHTGRRVSLHYTAPRIGDVRRNYADITKSKTILGYEPQYDLDQGLAATLEYFLTTTLTNMGPTTP